MARSLSLRAGALCIVLAGAFFLITATTFASLGVILPAMIAEFQWSWGTAGLGFTMLALLTGVFSPIAATSLERLGARFHYALGGAVVVAGHLTLSYAQSVGAYLVATSLLGAGFALLANVPGTYIVARATALKWRNIAIGLYLAAGGAGGVAGPLMANALLQSGADWRAYWFASALAIAAAAALIVLLADPKLAHGPGTHSGAEAEPEENQHTDWSARAAMSTPAFAIICAALTVAYFCGVTVSTWSVAHLEKTGLATSFAVAMFSLYSGLNAGARALGGWLVKRVSARALLVCAMASNAVGMSALAFAGSPALAVIFAVFDGFAFGMAMFATTALLIEYFGLKNSPALLGGVNLAATIAMLGPTIAGWSADHWQSFSPIFMIYAGAALVAAIFVATMPAPENAPKAEPAPA
ncbi:MAG: MFS transporter [Parvularculaceae bacterium]|nr:MFS transporter [Parvularculaceae bacterium]